MAYYLSVNRFLDRTANYLNLGTAMPSSVSFANEGDYVEFDIEAFTNPVGTNNEVIAAIGGASQANYISSFAGDLYVKATVGTIPFALDIDLQTRGVLKVILESTDRIGVYFNDSLINSQVYSNRNFSLGNLFGAGGLDTLNAHYYRITFGNTGGPFREYEPGQIDFDDSILYDKIGSADTPLPLVGSELVFYASNEPPVVVVDGVTVLPSSVGTIIAQATDPDGDALTYAWTQTAGEAVALVGGDTKCITFEAPLSDQTLSFEVAVSDAEFTVIGNANAIVDSTIASTTNVVQCDGLNSFAAPTLGDILNVDLTIEIDNLTVKPEPDKVIFSQTGDIQNVGELSMFYSFDGLDLLLTVGSFTVVLGTPEVVFGKTFLIDDNIVVELGNVLETLKVYVNGIQTFDGGYAKGAFRVEGMKFRVGASGTELSPTGSNTSFEMERGDSFGNVRVMINGTLTHEYIVPDSGTDVYDFGSGIHGVIENASEINLNVIPYDVLAPTITANNIDIGFGDPFVSQATAIDTTDGDITLSIKVVDFVDSNVTGDYSAFYSVRDSLGFYDLKSNIVTVGSENFFYEAGTQIKIY